MFGVRDADRQSYIRTPFNISGAERAHLINWIVMIHGRLVGLRQETLHITVNIIDRILSRNETPPN